MIPVPRSVSCLVLATLWLGCAPERAAAPDAVLAAAKSAKDDGADACRLDKDNKGKKKDDLVFVCAIEIDGDPIASSQKSWVEQNTGTYYLSDASNFGVDVIDIRTHRYVGRIDGFVGNRTTGGGTETTNGAGPNAFVSAKRHGGRGHDDDHPSSARLLFVSDGNSTVRVVDPDARAVIAVVSTAKADCDGGTATTKYCGRSNEIAYDPVHRIVAVSNPNPLSHVACSAAGADCTNNTGIAAAGAALDGYVTFFSAEAPYTVLGHLSFGPGTVEGHIWVPQLQRFLLPMQNPPGNPFMAVINPVTMTEDLAARRTYNCAAIPGTANTGGNNNLQLASGDILWAQLCGRPIQIDVVSGAVITLVAGVGTGDQAWYNPGDGNQYVTGGGALNVINARTGELQQVLPNQNGASPSAWKKTNEVFHRVTATTNPASRCPTPAQGCVVVFAHADDD